MSSRCGPESPPVDQTQPEPSFGARSCQPRARAGRPRAEASGPGAAAGPTSAGAPVASPPVERTPRIARAGSGARAASPPQPTRSALVGRRRPRARRTAHAGRRSRGAAHSDARSRLNRSQLPFPQRPPRSPSQSRPATTPAKPAGTTTTPATSKPVHASAVRGQTFVWVTSPDAGAYEFQLFQGGERIFRARVDEARLELPGRWRQAGRPHALLPGELPLVRVDDRQGHKSARQRSRP